MGKHSSRENKKMKLRKIAAVAMLVTGLIAIAVPAAMADDSFKSGTTIRSLLTDSVGKRVGVRLDSREELEGTVTAVGDQLVQISKLAGRDYYDAYVSIDRISAVILKTR
jgi:hypothetical protein